MNSWIDFYLDKLGRRDELDLRGGGVQVANEGNRYEYEYGQKSEAIRVSEQGTQVSLILSLLTSGVVKGVGEAKNRGKLKVGEAEDRGS